MEATVLQSSLKKTLEQVKNIIPGRSLTPELENILIEATNNRLYISATNMETAIRTYIDAEVSEPWSTCIPGRLLYEFVKNIPDGRIVLLLVDDKLQLITDGIVTTFNALDEQYYPIIPKIDVTVDDKSYNVMNSSELSESITLSTVSAPKESNQDNHTVLEGMYLRFKNQFITFCTADRFRLSYKNIATADDSKEQLIEYIIPVKSMLELSRILTPNTDVIIAQVRNNIVFVFDHVTYICRLIAGKYPDVERILFRELDVKLEVQREDLIQAIKLASLFGSKEIKHVLFDIKNKSITLSSRSEKGEYTSSVACERFYGEDVKIRFNSMFLLEQLISIPSRYGKIILEVDKTAEKGMRFFPVENPEYYNFLMQASEKGTK